MKTAFYALLIPVLLLFSGFNSLPQEDIIARDVLAQTNLERQHKGLKSLEMKEALNKIAREHSVNMAAGKVPFSHDGFQERYAKARNELKVVYSFAENVAFGPTRGKEVVEYWMTSKGHKANILGDFTTMGLGMAIDSKGVHYYTQVFCKE